MLTGIIYAPNPYVVARTLASRGLAVFPVRAKRPLTPKGVYSATSDLDLLARMDGWRNADACGLATGKASGVDVLDVDVRSALPLVDRSSPLQGGVDGLAVLAQMGALPETLAASTPSGGRLSTSATSPARVPENCVLMAAWSGLAPANWWWCRLRQDALGSITRQLRRHPIGLRRWCSPNIAIMQRKGGLPVH